jgi:hypothetical protein
MTYISTLPEAHLKFSRKMLDKYRTSTYQKTIFNSHTKIIINYSHIPPSLYPPPYTHKSTLNLNSATHLFPSNSRIQYLNCIHHASSTVMPLHSATHATAFSNHSLSQTLCASLIISRSFRSAWLVKKFGRARRGWRREKGRLFLRFSFAFGMWDGCGCSRTWEAWASRRLGSSFRERIFRRVVCGVRVRSRRVICVGLVCVLEVFLLELVCR